MHKKIIFISSILLSLSLVGCSLSNKNSSSQQDNTSIQTSVEQVTSNATSSDKGTINASSDIINTSNIEHTHNFSNTYKKDEDKHWKECACGEKTEVGIHTYGKWVVVNEPSEELKGLKEKVCSVCGYKVQEEIDKLEHIHSYTETIIKEPTCLEKGIIKHTCVCGDSYEEEIKALGHNYKEKVINPTCIDKGYTLHTCTRCEDIYKDTYTNELGHNYEEEVINHTCIDKGYTLHTCTRCDDFYKDTYIEALGHSFTNYVSDNNADCIHDGTKTAKCDRCDETDSIIEVGTKTGVHNYINGKCNGCGDIEESKNLDYMLDEKNNGYILIGIGECKSKHLKIPESKDNKPIISIASSAFENNKDIESVILSNNIETIEGLAFYNCKSLSNLKLGAGLKQIGSFAFEGCIELTSIEIPDSVEKISKRAFCNCEKMKFLSIGKSVKTIEEQAFYRCIRLTNVVIPKSVVTIGKFSFYDCLSLTSIIIGENVKSIGKMAFYGCDILEIYCEAVKPNSSWDKEWNSMNNPVFYYSETRKSGGYWHYSNGDQVAKW